MFLLTLEVACFGGNFQFELWESSEGDIGRYMRMGERWEWVWEKGRKSCNPSVLGRTKNRRTLHAKENHWSRAQIGEVENQVLLLIVGIEWYIWNLRPLSNSNYWKECALVSKNNCTVTVSRVAKVVFPLKKIERRKKKNKSVTFKR